MGQNSNQCLPASFSYKISFLCPDSAVSTDLHQPCCKCHVLTLITLMLAAKTHRQLPSWGSLLLRFFAGFILYNEMTTFEKGESTACPALDKRLFITFVPSHESFFDGIFHHPVWLCLIAGCNPFYTLEGHGTLLEQLLKLLSQVSFKQF